MTPDEKPKFLSAIRWLASTYPGIEFREDHAAAYWTALSSFQFDSVRSVILAAPGLFPRYMPTAGALMQATASRIKQRAREYFESGEAPESKPKSEAPCGPRCRQLMLEWQKDADPSRDTPHEEGKRRMAAVMDALEKDDRDSKLRVNPFDAMFGE